MTFSPMNRTRPAQLSPLTSLEKNRLELEKTKSFLNPLTPKVFRHQAASEMNTASNHRVTSESGQFLLQGFVTRLIDHARLGSGP